jgi:hypothetical protein
MNGSADMSFHLAMEAALRIVGKAPAWISTAKTPTNAGQAN